MRAGETASIKLPEGLPVMCARLLLRSGHREATPFIWRGDVEGGDDSLYVAFGPLRNKRQYFKLLSQGSHLVEDVVLGSDGTSTSISISAYMKDKLDDLWSPRKWGFGEDLKRTVAENPGLRIIFAGISHGGALAQAAALRFALEEPARRPFVFVISWNAYKWTDVHGSTLAGQVLGDRLVPLVLSTRSGNYRRWDSVPEFPPGFSPMPDSMLLDVDSGTFFGNLQLGEASLSVNFAARLVELHFAKAAISGMKKAMERDISGRTVNARRHWQLAKSKITQARHKLASAGPVLSWLSTSFLLQPMVEESRELELFGSEPVDDMHDGDSDDEMSGAERPKSDLGKLMHMELCSCGSKGPSS